ncbi:MAG: hypothetical protein HN654_03580 [Candidatus Marinimicrobia bacterium]|jgi:hypothetical protein|nr:hypothetical protein [Candidatus Neomarinimicrobiota bacterium]MBT7119155.1 hypothetical protein [Candidatus Neomarinimicrobiota bacterium]MBT7519427.1 hypothetical protein [Candidatus Neomarinimicrobiota bacterium]
MNNFYIFTFLLFFQFGSLKSEPGQLIDYTHQSTMTQDDVIFFGDYAFFGPSVKFTWLCLKT